MYIPKETQKDGSGKMLPLANRRGNRKDGTRKIRSRFGDYGNFRETSQSIRRNGNIRTSGDGNIQTSTARSVRRDGGVFGEQSNESKQKILVETLKQIDSGKVKVTEEQYRDLQREIVLTDNKLEKLTDEKKEFGSVSQAQLKAVGDNLQ